MPNHFWVLVDFRCRQVDNKNNRHSEQRPQLLLHTPHTLWDVTQHQHNCGACSDTSFHFLGGGCIRCFHFYYFLCMNNAVPACMYILYHVCTCACMYVLCHVCTCMYVLYHICSCACMYVCVPCMHLCLYVCTYTMYMPVEIREWL